MTKTLFWLANAVIIGVQTGMHYVKKSLSCALLINITVIGFALAGIIQVSAEAPGIIVIISSDTTWTKADSPHTLTGPVFVSNGATLTIEAGATVDLNSYYLLVNGTLRVLGRSSEQVYIDNGEKIEFTKYSTAWSESDSGCILEHADINSTISLKTASPKINNCVLNLIILEGNSSPIISNNDIGWIALGENNIIMGNPTISNNIIRGIGSITEMHIVSLVKAGSPTISHNIINGQFPSGSIHLAANSPTISDNVVVDGGIFVVARSPVITNNIVNGSVEIKGCEGSLEISSNTITPPSRVIVTGFWPTPSYTEWYLGIFIDGNNKLVNALISDNTISGSSSGIKLGNLLGSVTIERNVVCDNIDDGISVVADINLTIVGNFIRNNTDNGIKDYWGKANMVIRNNTITDNSHGITDPGPALIERNLIADNNVGLDLASQATVQNNTITNNDVAIRLKYCPSAKINSNNIENYGENSIYLINTSGNVDATNNWWGTTDTQAINLTIHDYKYDLGLSKVNFTPFLTKPNPEATSDTPTLPITASFEYSPAVVYAYGEVNFDANASFAEYSQIANYTWDFGDGNVTTTTSPTIKHTYTTPSSYDVSLTVTDEFGYTNSTSATIEVLQDEIKPTADAGQDKTVKVDTTVTFNASASSDNLGIVSYEWDFGDGATASGVTATHIYTSEGTYTVTLTVRDVAGNADTHQITVTVQSDVLFLLVIIGAAAIAVAAVAVFLWKKRKKVKI